MSHFGGNLLPVAVSEPAVAIFLNSLIITSDDLHRNCWINKRTISAVTLIILCHYILSLIFSGFKLTYPGMNILNDLWSVLINYSQ